MKNTVSKVWKSVKKIPTFSTFCIVFPVKWDSRNFKNNKIKITAGKFGRSLLEKLAIFPRWLTQERRRFGDAVRKGHYS